MKAIKPALKTVPFLLIAAIITALPSLIDLEKFFTILRHAQWQLVALAGILNLAANTAVRTFRFAALLSPLKRTGPEVSFTDLSSLLLATRALNTVLPARTGESLRLYQLNRINGYPVEGILAALMVEPLIEVLSLGIPAFFLFLILPPPAPLLSSFYIAFGIGFIVVATAAFFGWTHSAKLRKESERLIGKFIQSLHLINDRRVWAEGVLWSWVSDLIDIATIALCLSAVGIDLNLAQWFIILVVVNVAISVPATPGSLGMLEAGAVLSLKTFGVDQSLALAFAVLYHASHLIPIALVGAFTFQTHWKKACSV